MKRDPSLLIVDDEKENRSALERFLHDENPSWNISSCATVEEAIGLIRKNMEVMLPIDVVLTDLVIDSETDGMRLLIEARKIDPLIMSILFTAKERSLDRYAAFDHGAFDVVEKNIRGSSAAKEINLKARAAIRYREWSQRINFLRRYFDPTIFGKIEKDPEALVLQTRLVSIAFWDIRGFSSLCEILKANPNLIAGFLREYCELGAKTIFENGGILDKFIGDGIMAIFGVEEASSADGKNHAASAIKAAIAFRQGFEGLRNRWIGQWKLYAPQKIDIGLGCGIHTGDALVGNVGTEFRDQFTALGPHVNLASRIESQSKSSEILLSQSTEARVHGTIRVLEAGDISDIKNIPGVYKLFSVQ